MSTCIFDIKNDGSNDLLLYLEPEGAEFVLPPEKAVQVHLFGLDKPMVMNHSIDERGRTCIALWPENGSYELFFNGKSVWEQL